MSKPLLFSGSRVPDPVRYLTYLFLRHPGTRERETTRKIALLDTYEYRFARAGKAVLAGTPPVIVQPPAVLTGSPSADAPVLAASPWFEGWRLRPVWQGSARIVSVKFQTEDPSGIVGHLVRFGPEWFFAFPGGIPDSSRLAQALALDRWEPLSPVWYRAFVHDKTGSRFLLPQGPKRARSGNFVSEFEYMLSDTLSLARLYEDGIKADEEPEPLHQYRVLIRKARALVSLSRDFLPGELAAALKAKLALLHRGTALLRDLDVQWAEWPALSATLEAQGGLPAPVSAYLERERQAEAQRVRSFLDSADYRRIFNDIQALLQTLPASAFSFSEAGESMYRRGRKRLARKIAALQVQGEDRAVHEVRIAVKGLRYIQEYFSEGTGKDSFSELRNLRGLQEQLGEFQDNCVRLERLRLMRADAQMAGIGDSYAWGYLLGILEGKKEAAKRGILQGFRERKE